jgi:hypothetical protein
MFDQPRGLREITASEPSTMPQYIPSAPAWLWATASASPALPGTGTLPSCAGRGGWTKRWLRPGSRWGASAAAVTTHKACVLWDS